MKFLLKIPSAFYTLIAFMALFAAAYYAASFYEGAGGAIVFMIQFWFIFLILFCALPIFNLILLIISVHKKEKRNAAFNIIMLGFFTFMYFLIRNF